LFLSSAVSTESDKTDDGFDSMYFDIVGEIKKVETIAVAGRIKDIMRLRKQFGTGR
jgi:hypothetical protein